MIPLVSADNNHRQGVRGFANAFTIPESLAMLVALFIFTFMCLGVAKKKQLWPFAEKPDVGLFRLPAENTQR
jgi:hypothetical protein